MNIWKIVLLVSLALSLTACSVPFATKSPAPCVATNELEKLRLELGKKEADFQLQTMKDDQELRIKVANQCAAQGGVPVIFNGNVDCKPGKK